ncbi:MAG TPA: DegV family protein [Aggregatilineaceae bacterium]|nr:DegV family protein [Aggregatilineaceae bacterium]
MIQIATDTIADLPVELVNQHKIHIIPAWVYLKTGKVRTDAVDTQALYDLLADEPEVPRTEPLSVEEYSDFFTPLIANEDRLIVVSASSGISRVFEIAGQAAQQVAPERVRVHDSGGISLWQGFQALRAAQMAEAGQDEIVILGTLERMRKQSHFYCLLDNLSYLHRGGRVNLAQYMLGLMLDLKPILMLKEGLLVPGGRVRGRERATIDMQMRVLEDIKGLLTVWVGVVHTKVPDLGQRLCSQMQNTLRPAYSLVVDAGPTISAHAGPGAVGVVVCPI